VFAVAVDAPPVEEDAEGELVPGVRDSALGVLLKKWM